MEYLLEVKDLQTSFFTEEGIVRAVDGVSFNVKPGEIVGVVGESGCGKSVVSQSIMRLVAYPPGKIVGGEILYKGQDLLKKSNKEMRKIRGNEIALIFQEPMTSFTPVYTIGNQIGEAIRLHQNVSKQEAQKRAAEMLKLVGIPRAEEILKEYPHRLSGGMRQRAMIAMALSCNPNLLIADEPTTALDVTIQAQILELMKDLQQKINTAIIFITHDLGVIAEMAQHVLVMYAGKVVEDAGIESLFDEPLHPYTAGLINSKPKLNEEREQLDFIPGAVPNPVEMPEGCAFNPRCPKAMDICREQMPAMIEAKPGHQVRCWLYCDERGGKA
ncbi:ABC transporter ATP-binding protein [Dethiobacter alkaliphilus]|uniref:ABC transporter ATP-binding protein n=1 Tax=Dethiobacter alkaliphilus TaxID=427926 RepID=UPI0022263F64|nr:ABC transporter ATP-binding protein [Dethiobacter alkaliphilus]MCW3490175.1 ABC transporter ATP-binding protein [Dethiobacter alkaliphilus]